MEGGAVGSNFESKKETLRKTIKKNSWNCNLV